MTSDEHRASTWSQLVEAALALADAETPEAYRSAEQRLRIAAGKFRRGKRCRVEGCWRKVKCVHLCEAHYWQHKRGEEFKPVRMYHRSRMAREAA